MYVSVYKNDKIPQGSVEKRFSWYSVNVLHK